jgi:hypothetical protein
MSWRPPPSPLRLHRHVTWWPSTPHYYTKSIFVISLQSTGFLETTEEIKSQVEHLTPRSFIISPIRLHVMKHEIFFRGLISCYTGYNLKTNTLITILHSTYLFTRPLSMSLRPPHFSKSDVPQGKERSRLTPCWFFFFWLSLVLWWVLHNSFWLLCKSRHPNTDRLKITFWFLCSLAGLYVLWILQLDHWSTSPFSTRWIILLIKTHYKEPSKFI